jgi:Aminoglycoside 3-N-acetyltransferase
MAAASRSFTEVLDADDLNVQVTLVLVLQRGDLVDQRGVVMDAGGGGEDEPGGIEAPRRRDAASVSSAARSGIGNDGGADRTGPQFGLPAPAALRPARNGVDYGKFPAEPPLPEGIPYTPGCGLINTSLGVFPATLIKRGGAVRGDHPLNSFAAFGPQAEELIAAQSPADVYGPIRELAAREGRILLIGVGLNRMTAIHLAEQQSGRRLFLRWAKATDGRVSMFDVGSCSEGFPRLEPVLRQYARPAVVGDSWWRAFPSRQVLDAARTAMREDQDITHCGDSDCLRCQDSIAGGPLKATPGGHFSGSGDTCAAVRP